MMIQFLMNRYVRIKGGDLFGKIESTYEMVTKVILLVLCSLCILLRESVNSLKCRTDVQQTNNQYQKIIQICKKRSTSNDDYDNDFTNEDEDTNDSSSVNLFGTKFFISGGSRFSHSQPNENRNRGNDQRNNRRYFVNSINGNWRNVQYHPRSSNNRNFSYFDETNRPSYDRMYNGNSENDGKQQEQACISQCFFNELNMVDQRGFPEQMSIIQFMTRNTYNPELQDFIEEAVVECFHYLDSDMRNNKCYFTENLLNCLIDKGKEKCEDWND